MDDSMIEATQALDFSDYGDEAEEEDANKPVGYLNVPCQKGFAGKLFPLHAGDNVVGRGESCNVCIPLKGLSREHACIEVKGDAHFIYDKGSRNRTRRNKHFLAASVRYELKDKDVLTFGDVDAHYQLGQQDDDETGSETGSESDFQTARVSEEVDETVNISDSTKSRLLGDIDDDDEGAESDASSDILQPTQGFANAANTQSMLGRNRTQTEDTSHVTVMETPAASKSKRFTDNLTLPESDADTTDDEGGAEPPVTMVVADSQDSGAEEKSVLIGAATQAYVGESDVTTDDERSPMKKSLLMQPTQAYNDSDISTCSEESPEKSRRKRSLLTAATQAYGTDDEVSPVKKSTKKMVVEPTLAYTMAAGIEPTQKYDMVEDDDEEEEEEEKLLEPKGAGQTVAYTMAAGIEPTQKYDMLEEEEEEDEDQEARGKSVLYEATQAYKAPDSPDQDKKADEDDGGDSDSSEEFVIDGDTEGEEEEDVSGMMDLQTLACDPLAAGDDDGTQVFEEADKANDDDRETQVVVTEDETQVLNNNTKKPKTGLGDQDATQNFNDDATQVFETNKRGTKAKIPAVSATDETQVFTDDATQVFDDKASGNKRSSAGAIDETQVVNEDATQVVCEDATQVLDEETREAGDDTETLAISEEATQVFTPPAAKSKQKAAIQNDATQVFDDATQVFDDPDRSEQPSAVAKDVSKAKKRDKASDEATQVFDNVAEGDDKTTDEEDGGEKEGEEEEEFDVNAMSTFAAPVEEMDDEDTEGEAEAVGAAEEGTQVFDEPEAPAKTPVSSKSTAKVKKGKSPYSNDDATQVFDADQTAPVSNPDETVAIQEDATVAVSDDAATVAIAEDATVAVSEDTATVAVTEDATLAVSEDEIAGPARAGTSRKGRSSRTAGKKQTAVSEEATQVFDEDQTAPIGEADETMAVEEAATVAVADPNVDDEIKTSKGKGRATAKASKKRSQIAASDEPTQVFPDTVDVKEDDPTVMGTEDATLALPDETAEAEVAKKSKTNSRSKSKIAKTVTVEDATMAISDIETLEPETKQPPKSKRVSKRAAEDNVEDDKADATAAAAAETLAVEEVEEETKPARKNGRRGAAQKSKKAEKVVESGTASDSAVSATVPVAETAEPEVVLKPGRRGRSSLAATNTETEKKEEEKIGRGARAAKKEKQTEEQNAARSSRGRKGGRKSAKVEDKEEEEVAIPLTEKKGVEEAGPSTVVEPETQKYGEGSDTEKSSDEAATQRYGGEEETQKYQEQTEEEDSATPDIAELGLVDDDDDLSPVVPKPPLVPIPSRSPLKSALASPQKRKDKSPSPKRVKFVSQSSDTSSEGATRATRGKKLQFTQDKGKGPQEKGKAAAKSGESEESKPAGGARATRGRKQASVETDTSAAPDTLPASTRPARGRRGKASATTDTDKVPEEPAAATSEGKQESGRASRGKASKKVEPSADSGSKQEEVDEDKPEPETTQAAEGKGSKKATRGKTRGKKKDATESVDQDVAAETEVEAAAEPVKAKPSNRPARSKTRGKKEDSVDSGKTEVEATTSTTKDKAGNKATRSKQRGKKEESVESVKPEPEVEAKQAPPVRKTGSKTRGATAKVESEVNVKDEQELAVNKRSRGRVKAGNDDENTPDIDAPEICEPSESIKLSKHDSVGDKKPTRGRTVKTETSIDKDNTQETSSSSRRSRAKGGAVEAKEANEGGAASREADTTVAGTSGRRGGRQNTKAASQDVPAKATEEPKPSRATKVPAKEPEETNPARSARGKRKNTAEEEQEPEISETPAKRLKTKEDSGKGKAAAAVGTPKSESKKVPSVSTPRGGAGRELDTSSLVNSPTLRRSTVSADKPRVMFTGVVDEQGEKVVRDLGGELVSSVYDCTHLVTDQIRRTVKFLCCLSRGVPIVTPQWLVSSRRSAFFSDPSPFIVRDDGAEKKFRCCLRSSLGKSGDRQLLTGYKIHVTKSVKPEPAHMKDIIQCAGAQYLGTMPKTASETTVVISCADDKPVCEAAMKAGIPVVTAEFILTGVLRQEVDTNSYLLFSSGNGNKRSATGSATETAAKKRKR